MANCVESLSKVVFLPFGSPYEKGIHLSRHGQYLEKVRKQQDLILSNEEDHFELSFHKVSCYKNKNLEDEYNNLLEEISDARSVLLARSGYQEGYKRAFKILYKLIEEQKNHLNGYEELKSHILPWNKIEEAIEKKDESILSTQEKIFIALCNSLIDFFLHESEIKQIPSLIQKVQDASASVIFAIIPSWILTEDLFRKLNKPYSILEIITS